MNLRLVFAVGLVAVALAVGSSPQSARAQQPTYLILGGPAATTMPRHHARQVEYPARAVGVTAPTYAYGWFGATPRKHWSRHFGYYRNYTQWTRR